MKQRIRLTESELKRMIAESVKRILKESVESEIYDNSDEYLIHQGWPTSWYGYYGPKSPTSGNKEEENEYSWKSLDKLNKLKLSNMESRKDDEEFFQQYSPSREDFIDGMYDYKLDDLKNERIKNWLDNEWKNTKEKEKYTRQADKRPLHRKGSLNRAMDESINRIVSESIRRNIR